MEGGTGEFLCATGQKADENEFEGFTIHSVGLTARAELQVVHPLEVSRQANGGAVAVEMLTSLLSMTLWFLSHFRKRLRNGSQQPKAPLLKRLTGQVRPGKTCFGFWQEGPVLTETC